MIINQFMVHSSFATQKPGRQKSTIAMKLIFCVPAVMRDTRFVPRTPPPAPGSSRVCVPLSLVRASPCKTCPHTVFMWWDWLTGIVLSIYFRMCVTGAAQRSR